MKHRKLVMGLLALGVVGGYGSGVAHLACARRWHAQQRQQLVNEVARSCVEAARGSTATPTVAPVIVQLPSTR
jgi:hypothetical protein